MQGTKPVVPSNQRFRKISGICFYNEEENHLQNNNCVLRGANNLFKNWMRGKPKRMEGKTKQQTKLHDRG